MLRWASGPCTVELLRAASIWEARFIAPGPRLVAIGALQNNGMNLSKPVQACALRAIGSLKAGFAGYAECSTDGHGPDTRRTAGALWMPQPSRRTSAGVAGDSIALRPLVSSRVWGVAPSRGVGHSVSPLGSGGSTASGACVAQAHPPRRSRAAALGERAEDGWCAARVERSGVCFLAPELRQ